MIYLNLAKQQGMKFPMTNSISDILKIGGSSSESVSSETTSLEESILKNINNN